MIVRILNKDENYDKFYDCRNSCLRKVKFAEKTEDVLLVEVTAGDVSEVILNAGDKVFYMNNSGQTIHIDRRETD